MIGSIETEELQEFYVAGITTRTINLNGQSQRDIGGLWQRIMEEGLKSRLINRLSDDVFNVYTDYESDHKGYYTAILRYKVSSLNGVPGGFTAAVIPAAKYKGIT